MGEFVKGDVVVLPFPFSDLSASKKRPALVIAVIPPYDDLILCMITSRGVRDASAIPLSQSDFIAGGLPRESNIRLNRLFTADSTLVLRTAGKLSDEKMDKVVTEIPRIISG